MNAAVAPAVLSDQIHPPDRVSKADWERVVATRHMEVTCRVEELRRLGPNLEEEQLLVTVDEVLTRRAAPGHWSR